MRNKAFVQIPRSTRESRARSEGEQDRQEELIIDLAAEPPTRNGQPVPTHQVYDYDEEWPPKATRFRRS